MSNKRYHTWCLAFEDKEQRNVSWEDEKGRGEIEGILASIFFRMNANHGEKCGFLNTDNIFLLRKDGEYQYVTFINTKGENAEGYIKMMFEQKNKYPCQGAKEFTGAKFELIDVQKGKNSWSSFDDQMHNESYVKCNKFTQLIAEKGEALAKADIIKTAELGTV